MYQDGEMSRSVPFSPDPPQRNSVFTFGIYGMELLHPTNAADSIRSVAGANVVSSDLNEVVYAIERCMNNKNSLLLVQVDTQRTLGIVEKLRSLIESKLGNEKHIEIVLYIESGVDCEHCISPSGL
jgi:hypothetical protein